MIETQLRDGLRDVIARSSQQPPMDVAIVLERARQARSRRRTAWAAGAVATAVVVIAVGATVALSDRWNGSAPTTPAAPGAGTAGPTPTGPQQPAATGLPTESVSGGPQDDMTADAGPHFERGAQLLDDLVALVPAGYTALGEPAGGTPDPSAPSGEPGERPYRYHQAEGGDGQGWRYLATVDIARGGGTGRLMAEVHTPPNTIPDQPCELARSLWGMGGECQVLTVGGQQVGVVVASTQDNRLDQWAGFRQADGTVVFLAQARSVFGFEAGPGLEVLPFTPQQLAELVTTFR